MSSAHVLCSRRYASPSWAMRPSNLPAWEKWRYGRPECGLTMGTRNSSSTPVTVQSSSCQRAWYPVMRPRAIATRRESASVVGAGMAAHAAASFGCMECLLENDPRAAIARGSVGGLGKERAELSVTLTLAENWRHTPGTERRKIHAGRSRFRSETAIYVRTRGTLRGRNVWFRFRP